MKHIRCGFIFIGAIFSILISSFCFSQPGVQWVQRFNSSGSHNDYVREMKIDRSGNIYLAGYFLRTEIDYDIVLLKYNSSGVFLWSRIFDGTASEYNADAPIGIEIGLQNEVYVGATIIDSPTVAKFCLLKYDSVGNLLRATKYDFAGYQYASSMCSDIYGNIYIAGEGILCQGCLPSAYMTVKFNPSVEPVWTRFYRGPTFNSDGIRDVASDPFGNIYVTGQVVGTLGTVTIKYNQNGDSVWVRQSLNGGNILEADSNFVYLLEVNRRILQYDTAGNLYWTRNSEGVYNEMKLDRKGSVYITGSRVSSAVVKKFNSMGDSVWTSLYKYNAFSINSTNSISVDSSFDVYTTGQTDRNTPWNSVLTICHDSAGSIRWTVLYNNGSQFLQHDGVKVLADGHGSIYVAGNSQGANSGSDIVLIKYSVITEIQQSSAIALNGPVLHPVYPNPFNPSAHIKYEISKVSDVRIVIFDVTGKQVFEISNYSHPEGTFLMELSGKNYPSGSYFLSLIVDDKLIGSEKLILVK